MGWQHELKRIQKSFQVKKLKFLLLSLPVMEEDIFTLPAAAAVVIHLRKEKDITFVSFPCEGRLESRMVSGCCEVFQPT